MERAGSVENERQDPKWRGYSKSFVPVICVSVMKLVFDPSVTFSAANSTRVVFGRLESSGMVAGRF